MHTPRRTMQAPPQYAPHAGAPMPYPGTYNPGAPQMVVRTFHTLPPFFFFSFCASYYLSSATCVYSLLRAPTSLSHRAPAPLIPPPPLFSLSPTFFVQMGGVPGYYVEEKYCGVVTILIGVFVFPFVCCCPCDSRQKFVPLPQTPGMQMQPMMVGATGGCETCLRACPSS